MKLHNYELEPFVKFLFEMELRGRESRMRTRLIKMLETHFSRYQNEKMDIAKQYARRDEQGGIVTVRKDDAEMIELEDADAANRELLELAQERAVVEQNEENRDMLLAMKEAVLGYDVPLKGASSAEWDRWCEIVEGIVYID